MAEVEGSIPSVPIEKPGHAIFKIWNPGCWIHIRVVKHMHKGR